MKSEGGRKRDPSIRVREESMVAISLYRGNLHRVPDVPRRWLMPTHNISIRDFKSLLQRRSKALSRILAPSSPAPAKGSTSTNPNRNSNSVVKPDGEGPRSNGSAPEAPLEIERVGVGGERSSGDSKERKKSDIGDDCTGKSADGFHSVNGSRPCFTEQGSDPVENGGTHAKDENPAVLENPNKEVWVMTSSIDFQFVCCLFISYMFRVLKSRWSYPVSNFNEVVIEFGLLFLNFGAVVLRLTKCSIGELVLLQLQVSIGFRIV